MKAVDSWMVSRLFAKTVSRPDWPALAPRQQAVSHKSVRGAVRVGASLLAIAFEGNEDVWIVALLRASLIPQMREAH